MKPSVKYADVASVYCVDMDTWKEADVLAFVPLKRLEITVSGLPKITLSYVNSTKNYVGFAAGFEFTSQGPEVLT